MDSFPLTGLLALVLVLGLAGATHPESEGICPAHVQYIPSDSETNTYPVYVANDELILFSEYWSMWIYAESNGVRGLQRDDHYCYTDGYTPETADTVAF